MSILRIGGIASGFDTEQIVRDLMRIERMRADRLFQQRQVFDWQKEQFRDITNQVRRFKDQFFDILRPETNMTSPSALKKQTATSSNPQVSVSAGANAMAGDSTFRVIQSATAAKATATQTASEAINLTDTMEVLNGKLSSETKMDFGADGQFTLNINGTDIVIKETDTLSSVLNRISSSNANVQAHYSTFSDTFTFTAKKTGAGHITTDDGGNFFTALGLVPSGGNIGQSGSDAHFEINGVAGSRSGNTFTIDGLTYTINGTVTEPTEIINITTRIDTDAIYNTIEKFINEYNNLIDIINGKVSEERFRSFFPLTDEQKEALSDKEIEKWEEKAQSGLLRRDPALESMLRNMRDALYSTVGDLHLTHIGIETSRDYRDNGKLVLKNGGSDLRAAIEGNPDRVIDLFTRRSDIGYSAVLTPEQRAQRTSESGLAHRLSDIINDNIRTGRDNNGRKGILLEKAGILGDTTQHNNLLDRRISDIDKQIRRMEDFLVRKEEQYYRQFAAMEKALQQLYSQGDWLVMQMQQLM